MQKETAPGDDPHAKLERILIDEFLESRGHTRESVNQLSAAEATKLLSTASEHASLRLAEIESRAHYVDEIHRSS